MNQWKYETYNFRRSRLGTLRVDIIIKDDEGNTITSYVVIDNEDIKVEYSVLNNEKNVPLNREQKKIIKANALELFERYCGGVK